MVGCFPYESLNYWMFFIFMGFVCFSIKVITVFVGLNTDRFQSLTTQKQWRDRSGRSFGFLPISCHLYYVLERVIWYFFSPPVLPTVYIIATSVKIMVPNAYYANDPCRGTRSEFHLVFGIDADLVPEVQRSLFSVSKISIP